MTVRERVIVVTGAAPGLGAAIATSAADAGATVVGADLVLTPPDERIVMRELDVTDEGQWRAFADWLRREYEACHGLVNNAGITMRTRLGDVDASRTPSARWRSTSPGRCSECWPLWT